MSYIDKETVKPLAHGRWFEILIAIEPRLEKAIQNAGNHVPCPMGTGNKDGFRFFKDSNQTGNAYSNSAGNLKDGFHVLDFLGWNFKEALEAVSQYLGNPTAEQSTQKQPTNIISPDTKPQKPNTLPAKLWRESKAEISEPVRTYINSRGLGEIKELPTALRCHALIEYREGKNITGKYPALIGSIIKGDELVGIQRHYLTKEGNKADVKANKSMMGVLKGGISGGAVRLGEPTDTLAITEGIETGLSVQLATGVPTWSSCTAALLAKVEIPETVKTILIFADKDKNGAGKKVAEKLAERLRTEGKKVKIFMPKRPLTNNEKSIDWLDIYNESGKDALINIIKDPDPLSKLEQEEQRVMALNDELEEIRANLLREVQLINKRHCLTFIGKDHVIMRFMKNPEKGTYRYKNLTISAFNALYSNQLIKTGINKKGEYIYKKLGTAWMEHPERLTFKNGIEFLPMKEKVNGSYNVNRGWLNLWTGFGVTQKKGAGIKTLPITKHLLNIICKGNEENYQYLINWIAYGFQFPERQAEVAIVLRGQKGTGKGTTAKLLMALHGVHAVTISTSKHLTGNFNGHLKDTTFLFADEALYAGDHAGESTLKALITESELTIEGKGVDVINMPNRLKVLMASNNDWVVPSSKDERRYLCLEMPKIENHPELTTEYFNELHKCIENKESQAIFLQSLLDIDLSNFNIRKYPETHENKNQRMESLGTIPRFLIESCQRGYILMTDSCERGQWYEKIQTEIIVQGLIEWGKNNYKSGYERPTRNDITKYLKDIGISNKKIRNTNGYCRTGITESHDPKKGYNLGTKEELEQAIRRHEKLPEN